MTRATTTYIVSMVGWALVTVSFLSACAILAFAMSPSGWQKIHARIAKTHAQSSRGTDAEIAYAFGAREMKTRLFLKRNVSPGEVVVVEYDAFEPARVREPSWSRRDTVFYGLPLAWSAILTGLFVLNRGGVRGDTTTPVPLP